MSQEKPLRFVAKCRRCGRAKNQHRAFSLECPIGKRAVTGYQSFSLEKFVGCDRPESGAEFDVAAD
jgi:hypothetical protein